MWGGLSRGLLLGGGQLIPRVVDGDLLDQDVDAIVNAWNRNIIPWWLLLPQGVSGAIKRRGGIAPFREVARHGPIALGEAVLTGAGRLPFKGIIHVAGINMLWFATERSIRGSVQIGDAHRGRAGVRVGGVSDYWLGVGESEPREGTRHDAG